MKVSHTELRRIESVFFVVHDLRRSAVRNMMPSGVQQAVAMLKISGHSTPHIFQRYNIIGGSDLHEAVKKPLGGGAIGSTADSDSVNPGSSPGLRAKSSPVFPHRFHRRQLTPTPAAAAALSSFWCGRGELNPHGLAATGS